MLCPQLVNRLPYAVCLNKSRDAIAGQASNTAIHMRVVIFAEKNQ